jgi:hypothetical protein
VALSTVVSFCSFTSRLSLTSSVSSDIYQKSLAPLYQFQ